MKPFSVLIVSLVFATLVGCQQRSSSEATASDVGSGTNNETMEESSMERNNYVNEPEESYNAMPYSGGEDMSPTMEESIPDTSEGMGMPPEDFDEMTEESGAPN